MSACSRMMPSSTPRRCTTVRVEEDKEGDETRFTLSEHEICVNGKGRNCAPSIIRAAVLISRDA